jgi:hypothetical protein
MGSNQTNKYDLESRTLEFARKSRQFVKSVSRSVAGFEDSKQLVRS